MSGSSTDRQLKSRYQHNPLSLTKRLTPHLRICRSRMPPSARHRDLLTHTRKRRRTCRAPGASPSQCSRQDCTPWPSHRDTDSSHRLRSLHPTFSNHLQADCRSPAQGRPPQSSKRPQHNTWSMHTCLELSYASQETPHPPCHRLSFTLAWSSYTEQPAHAACGARP